MYAQLQTVLWLQRTKAKIAGFINRKKYNIVTSNIASVVKVD